MANDPSATQASEPEAPSEEDFQAFLAALSGSARGRTFLAEHARRSRSEDSTMLLSAVQRLEGLVLSQTPPPAAENPIDELRGMLEAIISVQAELDVGTLAAQVANLAALIESVQQRIETMVAPAEMAAAAAQEPLKEPPEEPPEAPAEAPIALEQPAPVEAEPAPVEAFSEPEMAALAEPEALPAEDVVPVEEAAPSEPSVAEAEPMPQAMPEDAWQTIPEVAWSDSDTAADETPPDETSAPALDTAPPAGLAIAALVETLVVPAADEPSAVPEATVIKAGSIPPPAPFTGEDFATTPRPRTMPPSVDPLADIKALSDDERVALFT